MDAPARLTWHAGSILPFASLWHTLLRAAALNRLRATELPAATTARPPGRLGKASALYNETIAGRREAFCVATLARWLGEPEAAFAWSHLGRLPRSVRCVASTTVRLCPVCIAQGYHSALFSIALLARCPMHGCELIDRCRCGRLIDGCIDPSALGIAGYCGCGRTAYFTPETCRRPTMARDGVDSLRPVAAWLGRLSTVSRPRFDTVEGQHADDRAFRRHLVRWCGVLGLGFPSCFERPCLADVPMAIVMATTPLAGRCIQGRTAATGSGDRADASRWYNDPATIAYRAMARHLRRHVARGSEAYAREFQRNPDPLQAAWTMQAHRAAMVAFADLVFTARMERRGAHRRWTCRAPSRPSGSRRPDAVSSLAVEHGFGHAQGLEARGRTWVEGHAGEAMAVQAWRHAQLDAIEAVRSGIADWRGAAVPATATWATTTLGGMLGFFSVVNLGRIDWALPRRDKDARRRAWQDAVQQRHAAMLARCSGPCLTWDEHGGWRVQEAIRPAPQPCKRHRLLGAGGDRPSFWIHQDSGVFVVRACNIELQACGSSPRAAIDALRVALRQYRRRFPLGLAGCEDQ